MATRLQPPSPRSLTRFADNGAVAWAVGLGVLFAVDGALIATGHRSLSSHARDHPVLTGLGIGALVAHLR